MIEPIQSEGGDHHFRGEFLQALRKIATSAKPSSSWRGSDRSRTHGEILGLGALRCKPEPHPFGKKVQTCGSRRLIDYDVDNVFKISSRINSTFAESPEVAALFLAEIIRLNNVRIWVFASSVRFPPNVELIRLEILKTLSTSLMRSDVAIPQVWTFLPNEMRSGFTPKCSRPKFPVSPTPVWTS